MRTHPANPRSLGAYPAGHHLAPCDRAGPPSSVQVPAVQQGFLCTCCICTHPILAAQRGWDKTNAWSYAHTRLTSSRTVVVICCSSVVHHAIRHDAQDTRPISGGFATRNLFGHQAKRPLCRQRAKIKGIERLFWWQLQLTFHVSERPHMIAHAELSG